LRTGWPIRQGCCLALLSLFATVAPGATDPEDELKSATVLTFIRHAEWRADAAGPINVGVVGRPAMVRTLHRTLEGRIANSRTIHVIDVTPAVDLRACHVLYIASDNREFFQILGEARAPHALTIGESRRFLEAGGAVNLLMVDGHMSFEVNRDALERAGIAISSTLLRYGQVTSSASHPRPPA
jgi:prepilin-type processing-associated H-X9-DG protein